MVSNSSFKELKDCISTALVDTTRAAGQISNEDLAFYRSSDPSTVPLLELQSSRLLRLARDLTRIASSGTEVAAPRLSNVESIDDDWEGIVDVFDNLLEKADASLDEYSGVIKRLSPSQEERIKHAASAYAKQKVYQSPRAQDIPKPQQLFASPPVNSDGSLFKPLLKSKPHALISLEECLQPVEIENGLKQYEQPYQTEILAAQIPAMVSVKADPITPLPFETTSAIFVDTLEAVHVMLEELKGALEIAIDLEHHDEHSYFGIVCLMQISTRSKDWLVDTLKPWRHDLQILNEVFANSNILKVFHGATMDIIWLQRDLGLYVVGLFDTYHASYALGYPRHSLAFLLKKFVDFNAAKQYQMADWRIRPLPTEMFNYARSDTHFLLYVYDIMRNELIDHSHLSEPEGNLIELVMQNSKQESLQRYERPIYDEKYGVGPGGWNEMLQRTPSKFNQEQFFAFRAIHQWRDRVAREEDESVSSVLTKRGLYNIAEALPMDLPSLIPCVYGSPSRFLLKRKDEFLAVIKRGRAAGIIGLDMNASLNTAAPTVPDNALRGIGKSQNLTAIDRREDLGVSVAKQKGSLPVRSDQSILWGSTITKSYYHSNYESESRLEKLHLALRLPDLTAEVFVQPKLPPIMANSIKATPTLPPKHAPTNMEKPDIVDDVFVVRDSANTKKRKRKDTSTMVLKNPKHSKDENKDRKENGIPLNGDAELADKQRVDKKRERTERRLERKRLRRAKGLMGYDTDKPQKEEQVAPFDYENAPSMLNANQTPHERSKATKAVDPYAKLLEAPTAPKAMLKTKREIAGKSFTFKK